MTMSFPLPSPCCPNRARRRGSTRAQTGGCGPALGSSGVLQWARPGASSTRWGGRSHSGLKFRMGSDREAPPRVAGQTPSLFGSRLRAHAPSSPGWARGWPACRGVGTGRRLAWPPQPESMRPRDRACASPVAQWGSRDHLLGHSVGGMRREAVLTAQGPAWPSVGERQDELSSLRPCSASGEAA